MSRLLTRSLSILLTPLDDILTSLEKVKEVFAAGIKKGLTIKTGPLAPFALRGIADYPTAVTYMVNHTLECQFADAKKDLIKAGRPTAEITYPLRVPLTSKAVG